MDNQQLCILNDAQKQVILTSRLGDGCLYKERKMLNYYYVTNSKSLEYITFKKELLGNLVTENIKYLAKNGYSQTYIYSLRSITNPAFKIIKNAPLENILNQLNDLGLALWFYDDGSLHKTKEYYNLYTNKFTLEEHENILVPYFENLGLIPKIRIDRKKDGRVFYYLSFSKYEGAYYITCILKKYLIEYYSYKIWSSETIQKWSKLQEELKSTNSFDLTSRQLSARMKNIKL